MIELEEALKLFCDSAPEQQQTMAIAVQDACGYVSAMNLTAPLPVPHFAKSAMDGYAVSNQDIHAAAKDKPVSLPVIAEILAGDSPNLIGRSGTAVRIMTGAPIPIGYDCVVKQENTNYGDQQVLIYDSLRLGENYIPIGEDIQTGQKILSKNDVLTSNSVGLLASLGFREVSVLQPVKVAIIATGNELRLPGEELELGAIYNSNSFTLASYIQSLGGQVVLQEICSDDPDEFIMLLNKGTDLADIILTTGGVSVGKKDFIADALNRVHADKLFHRVNMKPGTPVLASVYQSTPVLSLSGNPFAALVNFHLFYWPWVAKFMGNEYFGLEKEKAVIQSGELKTSHLRRFVRAYAKSGKVDLYTRIHHSSVFSNLADSNCIVEQPVNQKLQIGDEVNVYYWKAH